jgi:hypothetical protein
MSLLQRTSIGNHYKGFVCSARFVWHECQTTVGLHAAEGGEEGREGVLSNFEGNVVFRPGDTYDGTEVC